MASQRRYSLFLHQDFSYILKMGQVKDLQTAKSKIPFKNVAEIDAHIKYVGIS